jgi:hypothetical protein
MVSKRRDRPYRSGRSPNWIKVKNRTHPAMSRVRDALSRPSFWAGTSPPFVLESRYLSLVELRMRRSWTPSIVPNGHDQTVYLVLNDFGELGRAYCEASEDRSDLETTISDLISGQYDNPVRVVAFNTSERWSEDVSEDIAREIMRRLGLAGGELPSSLKAFVDSHLGPDRQLTLRLA